MTVQPTITIEPLAPTGDRDDFRARVVGPGDTDYSFKLSITRTVGTIWGGDSTEAATNLVEKLVYLHGTARAFPEEGFWFDSYNAADTVAETRNRILNLGWNQFVHPAARVSLGASLFNALDELDQAFVQLTGQPFLRSLDVLFERSRALEDLETEARDNPHFIYRVCILSAIIDRFNFKHDNGSLTGLREWLAGKLDMASASTLTRAFQQVKNLRKQYPIHEHFSMDTAGERSCRQEVMAAEQYFGFQRQDDYVANWNRLLIQFRDAIHSLTEVLRKLA